MDINRLRYFIAIADSGTMAAAAGMLRISAPALSKAMGVLEDELDVKLWARNGRNIVLTDRGLELLPRVRELVLRADQLRIPEESSRKKMSELRIGTFEVFSTYVFGEIMNAAKADYRCELHEMIPGEIEDALIDRKIDIGITYIPIPHRGLHFEKIATVKMGIYARSKEAAAWQDIPLDKMPFAVPITPIHGSPNRVRGLDGWPEDKLSRDTKYKITLLESALELCRHGKAVAYIPHFIATLHNRRSAKEFQLQKIERKINGGISQDVYVVRREQSVESAEFRFIAKTIRRVCSNLE